jgi:hypothetical protein
VGLTILRPTLRLYALRAVARHDQVNAATMSNNRTHKRGRRRPAGISKAPTNAPQGDVVANGVVIPRGAIAADLQKQAPYNSYGPKLFYVDEPFTCIDCDRQDVWTAAKQQKYYEVAKGSIYGRAIRCRDCRREHREFIEHRRRRSQSKPFDPAIVAQGVAREAERKAKRARQLGEKLDLWLAQRRSDVTEE